MNRLTLHHPAVEAALAAVPEELMQALVHRVAVSAAEANEVAGACDSAKDLSALVTELDEEAWAAQEADDLNAYLEAFCRARAADAWTQSVAVLDRDSAADALYDAVHAFGADAEAEARVVALLRA